MEQEKKEALQQQSEESGLQQVPPQPETEAPSCAAAVIQPALRPISSTTTIWMGSAEASAPISAADTAAELFRDEVL